MKYLLLAFLAISMLSGQSYAQSQTEMNEDACGDYKKLDQQLSDTYQKILSEYASDKTFIKNFKAAQGAWLVYRDAQIKALYPHPELGYYGSVLPMCECEKISYYTSERIKELKQWLDGIEEGDVCTGSIKIIKRPAQ